MTRLFALLLIIVPKPSVMTHEAITERKGIVMPLPFEWVELDSVGWYHVHMGQEGIITDDLNNLK